MDPWSSVFAALLALALAAWLAAAVRARFAGFRGWRSLAFLSGALAAIAAAVSPLDGLGHDRLLTAHLAQHIALADLAAPLLLLGLPLPARQRLSTAILSLGERESGWARALTLALSPAGAFVLWAVVTYLWFVPTLHLLAAPTGAVHLLDNLSFLGFGLLIWLGAFDPRPTRSWRDGLRQGGIPWWGRHIYAMVTRLAMLPPAFAVWLSGSSTYHDPTRPWPFSLSPGDDQELAASVMIGFEMVLFGVAVVLAFIFVAVSEGRKDWAR